MFELTVISGKGGTGKSSITRALLDCAGTCVSADCDVDAANLHLVLGHTNIVMEPFISGFDYRIDPEICTSCGLCQEQCAYNAIRGNTIDPYSCEGCGVCHYFCPADAVIKTDKECGEFIRAESPYGPFVYARLHPGEENSGKLVTRVREAGKEAAEEKNLSYVINDGPPGIGCPVIASITGVSAVLIVTEPTITGYEDFIRAAELVSHFRIPVFVCVNKADINPDYVEKIRQKCNGNTIIFTGIVDYDTVFNEAQKKMTSVMEIAPLNIRNQILTIWNAIIERRQSTI